MRSRLWGSSPGALSVLLAACAGPKASAPEAAAESEVQTLALADVGLSETALDATIDPCQDFYAFACGGWIEQTEIPSDRSRWVRSFSVINEENQAYLKTVLEAFRTEPGEDPVGQRLGAFYRACMSEETADARGLSPIEPLLQKANGLRTRKQVLDLVAELHAHGIWVLWDLSSTQDFKDATQVIGYLDQNGLGLPDRDYYFDEDKAEIREAYVAHIAKMFELTGARAKTAASDAKKVMSLETRLADASLDRTSRRDPNKLYHRLNRDGVEESFARIDWDRYFGALGQADLQDINVTHVPFFERVNELMAKTKPSQLRSYFRWHVLRATASTLSAAFDNEAFAFKKVLTGAQEQLPRWKRCIDATDSALGELLGQPYVAARFAGDSREAATRYVKAIGEAFRANLDQLDWMDADTRTRAEEKLDKVAYLIGYPSEWENYEFEIGEVYASNALAARRWSIADNLAKIGQPVDREEWFISPPTVNAYYSPLRNQMVFPAGILQHPFYDVDSGVAANLGAMGMVVGHELTHGFDDKGSLFDANGNLEMWYEPETREAFEGRTQCVADQYAGYEPLPGLNLNGKLTLGENIADMGGVKLAFQAYRALRADAQPIVASGYTEDQQFFISTAQIWCAKVRDAEAKLRIQTDPHSPPKYRVNGSLSNLPEFADAFQCAAGTPMAPTDRCTVW
ncbi:MAG: M13 family metallopeptidase [Myxococcota bacterium]